MTNDINAPVLDNASPLVEGAETAPPVDNTGNTDELSLAVAAESSRNAVHIPEPVAKPCKYQLDYLLDGKRHTEKHVTIEGALASVRRLRTIGIVPATSTL